MVTSFVFLDRSPILALTVVYRRVVVQVASTCLSIEWAISRGGRSQARGTCVRGHIFVRMDGNLTVDRV